MSIDTNVWLTGKLGHILATHVEPIFKRDTKFTLIARKPGDSDADVLVTSDDLNEVAALIERSKTREAKMRADGSNDVKG